MGNTFFGMQRKQHIILDGVKYYDMEEEKFYDAVIKITGRRTKTLVYGYNPRGTLTITVDVGEDVEARIFVHGETEKLVDIELNGYRYLMDHQSAKKIIDYSNELNKTFIRRRKEFRDVVNLTVAGLIDDKDLFRKLFNFICQVPSNLFMDFRQIVLFEIILENEDPLGKNLFISSERIRLSFKEEEKINKSEDMDLVCDFKKEHFDRLVDFLRREIKTEDHSTALYLTYRLLQEAAKLYFANIWEKEHGGFFSSINEFSISEAVKTYCSIDSIDPKNLRSAGEFIYYLLNRGMFGNGNYLECYNVVVEEILNFEEQKRAELFEERLNEEPKNISISINAIDIMNGSEFEYFVADIFRRMGYGVTVTKASGDQGIDIIAQKNDLKIGIQAKCYSGKVPNSAIQQVAAGVNYYRCDKGMVVTNNYFTESAKDIAEANNVVLWDRTLLIEKINELY